MRKRVGTEQTPAQILEAAIKLFARRGYAAVSVDQLADEVGLTKGSVYHYFRSKADVLVSATLAALGTFGEGIAAAAAQLSGEAPERRLLGLVRAHNELTVKHHDAFAFLVRTRRSTEEVASAPERRELRARYAAYEQPFVDALEDGMRAGAFRPVNPVVVARFVIGACNWMAQWHRPDAPTGGGGGPRGARGTEERSWEEEVLDVLVRGLRLEARPAPAPGRRRRDREGREAGAHGVA
jgi:AcrR family transcriptional regulator